MSFLFINKTLRLINLKTKTAINAKILVFVICIEAIIYLLLYNLHNCNASFKHFYVTWFKKKSIFSVKNKFYEITNTRNKKIRKAGNIYSIYFVKRMCILGLCLYCISHETNLNYAMSAIWYSIFIVMGMCVTTVDNINT